MMIQYDYEEEHIEGSFAFEGEDIRPREYVAPPYSEDAADPQSTESNPSIQRSESLQSELWSIEDWKREMLLEEEADEYLRPYMGRRQGGNIYSERRLWQLRRERGELPLNPDIRFRGMKTQHDRLRLEIAVFEYGVTGRDAFIAVRYADNSTQDQIADMLGIRQPMVNKRLGRIRRHVLLVLSNLANI